ncbi:hypothetical protein CIHG_08453 [Coccidioides immitis H538.4]|nr:hypothetical protein CIHG_08453 [Coccidioides immitis H538.4]
MTRIQARTETEAQVRTAISIEWSCAAVKLFRGTWTAEVSIDTGSYASKLAIGPRNEHRLQRGNIKLGLEESMAIPYRSRTIMEPGILRSWRKELRQNQLRGVPGR